MERRHQGGVRRVEADTLGVRLDRLVSLVEGGVGGADACVALGPIGLELNALVRIIQRRSAVAQRVVAQRAVRVEDVQLVLRGALLNTSGEELEGGGVVAGGNLRVALRLELRRARVGLGAHLLLA